MGTSFDKALAAAIVSLVALGALIFHWSIPGWLTETNILEFLSIAMPIIVSIIPNKATTAQKVQVLTDAGVIPPGAKAS
jgi:hypothetical protein